MRRFYDYHSCRQRLSDSIIRYDGVPVFILGVHTTNDSEYSIGDPLRLEALNLITQKTFNIDPEDKKLDTSSPPIGYVNYKKGNTLFLERIPRRRWKSGLHNENLSTVDEREQVHNGLSRSVITSKALGNSIIGDFPSIGEAQEQLDKIIKDTRKRISEYGPVWRSIAFSRRLALLENNFEDRGRQLGYQGRIIANCSDKGIFKLTSDFFYMGEFLEKNNLKVEKTKW